MQQDIVYRFQSCYFQMFYRLTTSRISWIVLYRCTKKTEKSLQLYHSDRRFARRGKKNIKNSGPFIINTSYEVIENNIDF